MKIGILTSSRADFGIYLPLLKALKKDKDFSLEIIAFGTHLSQFHGYTLNQIKEEGFVVNYTIESMLTADSANAVSTAMGLTMIKFASFWKAHSNDFNIVFCLGDRYEMFAAVMAGVAFQVKFAHLHGGEKTLGAIDNVFRHSISHASSFHFTSTYNHQKRVETIIDEPVNVYNVGALSLDSLKERQLLTVEEFKRKWNIDLSKQTILLTFHPETVHPQHNINHANEIVKVIKAASNYQFLITMPNADTSGNGIRRIFEQELQNTGKAFLIENLGSQSYFTAMRYCQFMLGNTSSGIIEGASFNKFVINLGNRQLGRDYGPNVKHVEIDAELILEAIKGIEKNKNYEGENIYYINSPASKIVEVLKSHFKHE